ncbi:MAG: class I SAM-dependent methyltransferase [Acidimicrobiales bacterium]
MRSKPETARTHIYRHLLDFPVEDQILDEVLSTPGRSVLDVGTGATGRSAQKAADRGAVVTSIEVNPAAIAEFGARPGMGLAAADLLALPLRDSTFDVVQVALHGFDYVLTPADRAAALAEVRRVLAPGGTLIFNGFNPVGLSLSPSGFRSRDMLKARLKYVGSGRFLRPTLIDVNGLELHQATVKSITTATERAGFRRRSVRNLSGSTNTPWIVGLLSSAPYYVFERADKSG